MRRGGESGLDGQVPTGPEQGIVQLLQLGQRALDFRLGDRVHLYVQLRQVDRLHPARQLILDR